MLEYGYVGFLQIKKNVTNFVIMLICIFKINLYNVNTNVPSLGSPPLDSGATMLKIWEIVIS